MTPCNISKLTIGERSGTDSAVWNRLFRDAQTSSTDSQKQIPPIRIPQNSQQVYFVTQ